MAVADRLLGTPDVSGESGSACYDNGSEYTIPFPPLNDRNQSGLAIRRRCFLRSSGETEKCETNRHRYLTLLSDRVSIHR